MQQLSTRDGFHARTVPAVIYPARSQPGHAKIARMSSPTVQISVLCYNGERYLAEAIESALAQTLETVQVAVIDDGSTDRSAEIAARYADAGVDFRQNPTNLGLSANWTQAGRTAKTDYVAVLHQDDRIRPQFAEVLASRLEQAPDAVAAICNTQVVDSQLRPLRVERFERKRRSGGGRFTEEEYRQLLFGNYIYGCSWLARPQLFERWQFEQRFGWVPDWNLWLSVLADPTRVVREDAILSEYRLHQESLSFDEGTLLRRVREEAVVVSEALERRPVPDRVARSARRMVDVRAVVYALQIAGTGRLRSAVRMLGELVRQRGAFGLARGTFGLLLLPDLWSTLRSRLMPRRSGTRKDLHA